MAKLDKLSSNLKFHYKDGGLFHDTKNDVKLLAGVISKLHDKINELVDEVNRLKTKIK